MVITVQILCHKLQQSRSSTLVSFQSALRGLDGQFSVGANTEATSGARLGCRPMACTQGSRSGEPARSQAVLRASIALIAAHRGLPSFE
jgi:hypothetical protein